MKNLEANSAQGRYYDAMDNISFLLSNKSPDLLVLLGSFLSIWQIIYKRQLSSHCVTNVSLITRNQAIDQMVDFAWCIDRYRVANGLAKKNGKIAVQRNGAFLRCKYIAIT